ncbi:radical SAM/SPASM domain-containing protein [Paracoccus sp. (in: a-proteobacteria)]|uniref:radical SAM/SPASM domain-containing protein n=1 Tax=Paracoccus sp. TaxID=267 RepID=UPI0026DF3FB8|nr:radical SAM/SPASM domain-containing protein [Paracoccus sp. (in: a-proteobacteria)]MDO5648001.1 radical SAM protein [Paracoccus sp. (in: a-proteobacteria)]
MWVDLDVAVADATKDMADVPPLVHALARFLTDVSISLDTALSLTVKDYDPDTGLLRWFEPDTHSPADYQLPDDLRALIAPFIATGAADAPLFTFGRDPVDPVAAAVLDGFRCNAHLFHTARPMTGADGAPMTRHCLDPWRYVEFGSNGKARPCCRTPWMVDVASHDAQNISQSGAFRRVRRMVATGHLLDECHNCHIRRRSPVNVVRLDLPPKVDDPQPTSELRVDVTGRCNLRCTYCQVTSPGYAGRDMDATTLTHALRLVRQMPRGAEVHVNGHGETTYHPAWVDFSRAILRSGHKPQIITNLAKRYSDDEIDTLSRFGVIQISLDSHDDAMMRRIRKAVGVGRVFDNIARIRDAARQSGGGGPKISFSVGIYDPSVWVLPDFAQELVAQGAQSVTFWSLVEYDHQTHVRALSRLSPDETDRARRMIAEAAQILKANRIRAHFAGDFLDRNGVPLTPP